MGRPAAASKARLRADLLAARRMRSPADLTVARAAIRSVVLSRAAVAGWRVVGCYVPLTSEPGSVELLQALAALGITVLVPVLLGDRDLDWAPWPDGTPRGVGAIAHADAVLVPALAVDAAGTRLGRGGGSYDRALARVPAQVPAAALLFADELVAGPLPREAWDRPVTAAVTPDGWVDLPRVDGEQAG